MLYRVKFLPYILVAFFASLFFFVSFLHHAFAFTYVNTDINTDTTWTLSGSPYIIEKTIIVLDDATLSIEPGVAIKFKMKEPLSNMYVFGKIIAQGTNDMPIYFTSLYDDIVAPETDDEEFCDEEYDAKGNVISKTNCIYLDFYDPQPRDWGGLFFISSLGSTLENTHFSYGKNFFTVQESDINIFKNIEISHGEQGMVLFNHSSVNFENAKLKDISSNGITLFNNSFLNFNKFIFQEVNRNPVIVFNESSFSGNGLDMGPGITSSRRDYIVAFNGSNLVLKDSIFRDCDLGSCINIFDGSSYEGEASLLDIDKTIFEGGNETAITIFGSLPIKAKINNSVFGDFPLYAIDNFSTDFVVDARKNFWGNASGPFHATANPTGLGEKISGLVDFDPWCKTPDCTFRNPVIFIPGVMGNDILRPAEGDEDAPQKLWLNITKMITDIGDDFMDALGLNEDFTPLKDNLIIGDLIKEPLIGQHFYDKIIDELVLQGYVEGEDIFTFPYDWRYGVSEENIALLKQKIINIKNITGSDKVDVVAHSTGGLLVKKYVIDNSANHSIDKAVFVGVPSAGAPQAVKMLVQGANMGIPFLDSDEMKKIAKNLPVVYDLSPSLEYYNKKGSYIQIKNVVPFKKSTIKDLNFTEANNYLIEKGKNKIALEDAHILHTKEFDNFDMRTSGVDVYNIAGCKASTFGTLVEIHNKNISKKDLVSYREPIYIKGDGTVPLESATFLPVDEAKRFFSLNADHAKMPSQDGTRQLITNIISGSSLPTSNKITQDIAKCKLNGRSIAVYSPIDIEVIDQYGNRLGILEDGINTENNIPNAYFDIVDEHKFLYLPTDEGQIYTINIKGTGGGTFTITDTKIVDDIKTDMQIFKNLVVSPALVGSIVLGDESILNLDNDGDGNVDQNLKPDIFLDEVEVLDFEPYLEEKLEEEIPRVASFGGGGGGGFPFVFVEQIKSLALLPQVLGAETSIVDTEKEAFENKENSKLLIIQNSEKPNIVVDNSFTNNPQIKEENIENAKNASIIIEEKTENKFGYEYIIYILIIIGIILLVKKFIKL